MPIYEYRCQECGEEFELIQSYSDSTATKCQKCGGKAEKLLSRSGFVLKGGGWYADGYGAKSKGGSSSKSSSSSSKD